MWKLLSSASSISPQKGQVEEGHRPLSAMSAGASGLSEYVRSLTFTKMHEINVIIVNIV